MTEPRSTCVTLRLPVGAIFCTFLIACAGTVVFAGPPIVTGFVTGAGFITDASHPMHPGDFRKVDVALRLFENAPLGEFAIEFAWKEDGESGADRYFIRRGRIFQIGENGAEAPASNMGDLSPATVAALHPAIVANAMEERGENLHTGAGGNRVFAWNDELWYVASDPASGRVLSLERRVRSDLFGDGEEEVRYLVAAGGAPAGVVVTLRQREIARFDFSGAASDSTIEIPAGDGRRDRTQAIDPETISFDEFAPHLFKVDLDSLNTRVVVAEFTDHLAVIEGAYSSRICDALAARVRERFGKPVRFFAFSHLHGQYLGGTRSWVHEGATVLVPPTTTPLVEEVVKSRHALRPDALEREPEPLRMESIPRSWRHEDATNALEVHNVESGHTDEYLIFYFPRQKVLLTGDLLFYRPGKPLTGRSKKLCETIAKLGLDVETCYATWPLSGYGTKNVVTREELHEGCGKAE